MLVWYNALGLVLMYWLLQWAVPRAAGPAFRRLPEAERVILVHHAMYCTVFALQVVPLTWRMGGAPRAWDAASSERRDCRAVSCMVLPLQVVPLTWRMGGAPRAPGCPQGVAAAGVKGIADA